MKTEIIWAELHAPLFLAGTNLGQKLDHKTKGGVKLEYDEEKRHLYITYNGQTARVPETSVLSMVEGKAVKPLASIPSDPVNVFDPNAAQVETPTGHVFAGPGKGKTGVGAKTK